jgi:hypothetical protein
MDYKRTRGRDGYRVYSNRQACLNCPSRENCTKSKTLREIEINPYEEYSKRAHKRAKDNPELYHRRQETVEHPYGVVKRVWGYGQFLSRGKLKATGEAALAFLAFNFLRVFNIMGIEKLMKALVLG